MGGQALDTVALAGLVVAPARLAAMPYGDVPDFLKKLRGNPASKSVALALEFLILTAARTGEVIGAKWSEIDPNKAIWTVSAERMKAKRKHRVPLSPRAIAIGAQIVPLPKRNRA